MAKIKKSLVEATLGIMRSVRFNVGLMIVLALIFIVGTLIPQVGDAPQEVEKFLATQKFWGPLFNAFGFFDIYHTPLTMGLLILIAADITVCRIYPLSKNLKTRLQWGSFVNHVGLVVVLVGCLMKAMWGFEEFVMILPGQDKPLQKFPSSTLSLFDFKMDFYPNTRTPKFFESDMQFSMDGKTKQGKLQVNSPMSFPLSIMAPLRFYQASWGATGMFKSAQLELGKRTVNLKMKESSKVPGTPFEVTANMMLPDFMVSAAGGPDTKSLEYNNPALSVTFTHAGFQSRPLWLLLHEPGVAFEETEGGVLRQAEPPPFKLAAIDPMLFSGIQVAFDPGFPVIIGGVLMILAGFFLMGSTFKPTYQR